MHGPERRGQHAIDTGDKGNPCRSRDPGARAAEVPEGDQRRDDGRDDHDPPDAQARHDRGGSLRNPVGEVDSISGEGDQYRERPQDVRGDDTDSRQDDAAPHRGRRILDLTAQCRRQLQPGERERHRREQAEERQVEFSWVKGLGGETGSAAVRGERHARQDDEDRRRQPRAVRAEVLHPFADAQTDEVETQRDPQTAERERGDEPFALGEMHEARASDIRGDRPTGEQQRRIIDEVVDPVPPPGDESVPRPEGARHPAVDPPLTRIDFGQLAHRHRRGQEENPHRQRPQHQAERADAPRRGEPAQSDDCRDVEQHDVAQSHHPRQRRRGASLGGRHRPASQASPSCCAASGASGSTSMR